MSNPFGLDGKLALITGGASGIGEATARVFSEAGARVLIVDLDAERARAAAETIPGGEARGCDVTDEEQVRKLFESIPALDILVNCAGIGMVGGIEETELREFQRLFRVNVDGTFLMTRAAIPLLRRVRGSVVNIGSVAGLVGIKRRFGYCATKGAVIAMTRQLAVEYPTQIRANCIAPGTVDTPFVDGYLEKYHREEKDKVRQELNERQPLGRLGKPEEIARLALYICSPAADFMSGSVITIDGGWTAG
ncbi:MAG: SDR family oxidoreductase [Acidobacteriaceae bacterium]|nr:SDR family oxidoreductase [Acidobacteriaceae bacterium]